MITRARMSFKMIHKTVEEISEGFVAEMTGTIFLLTI
jgi:hypothetical protein